MVAHKRRNVAKNQCKYDTIKYLITECERSEKSQKDIIEYKWDHSPEYLWYSAIWIAFWFLVIVFVSVGYVRIIGCAVEIIIFGVILFNYYCDEKYNSYKYMVAENICNKLDSAGLVAHAEYHNEYSGKLTIQNVLEDRTKLQELLNSFY